MKSRAKHGKAGASLEYSSLSDAEKIEILEKENKELAYEINDVRTTLELNKSALLQILTSSSKDQQVSSLIATINNLVKENISLQNEVQRLQEEFMKCLRNNYFGSLEEINGANIVEDSKCNTSEFRPINILGNLNILDNSEFDAKSMNGGTNIFNTATLKNWTTVPGGCNQCCQNST